MCGIIGSYSSESENQLKINLENGLSVINHRGKDDRGINSFKIKEGFNLFLGHSRLSIIDLSIAGHQPMLSSDESYALVYNGEIYNYKEIRDKLEKENIIFNTNTDTEVLLKMIINWGLDSLIQIKGMFAFAFFDKRLNKLYLVRDAFGIKPLYYKFDNQSLYFCSEIQGISKLTNESFDADIDVSTQYLLYGLYDNTEKTFFKDVFQVMPACFLTIDFSSNNLNITKTQWWNPSIIENKKISFEEALFKTKSIFEENIKLHLISDVPIGVALSGGIDSSSVVCMINKINPEFVINTFSYIAKDSEFDESYWIDIVNNNTNSKSNKILVEDDELLNDIYDLIQSQGEPFGGISIYAQYRVFKLAAENGVKVTLDGQGADELLAGYLGYPEYRIWSMLDEFSFIKVFNFIYNWAKFPNRSKSYAYRAIISYFIPNFIKYLFKKYKKDNIFNIKYSSVIKSRFQSSSKEYRGRRVVNELRSALLGNGLMALLRHADRNSMRWTIESRVPFLTINFAEFLLTLPEEYLISIDGITKNIFREAMKNIVPEQILSRKDKIGFKASDNICEKLVNSQFVDKLLFIAKPIPLFDYKNLETYFSNLKNRKIVFDHKSWRIINYILWCNKFEIKFKP
jgi:asparagine synthase (glutamine-hydrolysing)